MNKTHTLGEQYGNSAGKTGDARPIDADDPSVGEGSADTTSPGHSHTGTFPPGSAVPVSGIFGTGTVMGGGKIALWSASIACGLVGGSIIGVLAFLGHGEPSEKLVYALCLGVTVAVMLTILAWALLVDRATVKGAIEHAESSVEDAWMQNALGWGFAAVMCVNGVLMVLLAIREGPISHAAAVVGLLASTFVGLIVWVVAYLVVKWKETR